MKKKSTFVFESEYSIDYVYSTSSKAKRVFLKVNKAGELSLVVPQTLKFTEKDLREVFQTREEWIKVHLKKGDAESTLPVYLHFPALNQKWKIEYIASGKDRVHLQAENGLIQISSASDEYDVYSILQKFVYLKAKKFLPHELEYCIKYYAIDEDFSSLRLRIGLQSSRWGSFSSNNTLSLNARLICLPLELVHHVILHELCHKKAMNHQQEFYDFMSTKEPNYKILDKKLKKVALEQWLWVR